ncbi:hypothetical protein BC939DRAFT_467684 [Gamsiella multidivaricata]|uniref:uncharacterized protein n=1 Tax=Gamsiella multidivaricata TaxID=101098 RepID=UPI00221F036A|nr:uncharacterized protein BC939DRAFT_467684 [Gamsiella multidivaricata]KAI7816826.1 hypothetical protein BC939DRAFT_467684 [Gamsiella multidivaricata]
MPQVCALDIPEVLYTVLSCRSILSPDDLTVTSLVSSSWYYVSRRALWQEVELHSESWEDPHYHALLAQLLKYGSLVRTLILKDCGADRSRFDELLSTMTNLQTILVDRLMLHSQSLTLVQSIEHCSLSRLRYLRLPHLSMVSHGIDVVPRVLESAYGLRHLELVNSDIDDGALAVIANACPKLKSLDLSNNEIVTFSAYLADRGQALNTDQDIDVSSSSAGVPSLSYSVSSSYRSPFNRQHFRYANNPYLSRMAKAEPDAGDDTTVIISTLTKMLQHQGQQLQQQTPLQMRVTPAALSCDGRTPWSLSSLLQSDMPFNHLEELSLVFCLGISNRNFQALFRSFRGKRLRALNLQFTNVEDSGLETLASTFSPLSAPFKVSSAAAQIGLTSVKVSFCDKITARGIRALVETCPQLLELEFLGCDSVSADCFHGPSPWVCTGLRQLEFTIRPRALFMMQQGHAVDSVAGIQTLSSDQAQDHYQQPKSQADDHYVLDHSLRKGEERHQCQQQQQKQQQQQQQQLHQDSRVDLRLHVQKSMKSDYHAMFRQLRLLRHLKSLHIYNNSGLDIDIEGVLVETAPEEAPDDIMGLSAGMEPPSATYGPVALESKFMTRNMEDTRSYIANAIDAAHVSDVAQQDDLQGSTSQPQPDPSPTPMQVPSNDPIFMAQPAYVHPFSFRMGLKALGRLKSLETLTLYERTSIPFGMSEARWVAKAFPQLSVLQLRGTTEIVDGVLEQLTARRPGVLVQVCPLFEY